MMTPVVSPGMTAVRKTCWRRVSPCPSAPSFTSQRAACPPSCGARSPPTMLRTCSPTCRTTSRGVSRGTETVYVPPGVKSRTCSAAVGFSAARTAAAVSGAGGCTSSGTLHVERSSGAGGTGGGAGSSGAPPTSSTSPTSTAIRRIPHRFLEPVGSHSCSEAHALVALPQTDTDRSPSSGLLTEAVELRRQRRYGLFQTLPGPRLLSDLLLQQPCGQGRVALVAGCTHRRPAHIQHLLLPLRLLPHVPCLVPRLRQRFPCQSAEK